MPPIPSRPPSPLPSITVNTPAPPAVSQPQPTPPAALSSSANIVLVIVATCIAMLTALVGLAMVIGAVVYFGGFWPAPNPSPVDFKSLGAEYARDLGPSYAPAWKSYAADIRNGKTMADASKSMSDLWAKNRSAIFAAKLQPALSKIIPEGTTEDKVTPAQRAAMAAAADALAEGLQSKP